MTSTGPTRVTKGQRTRERIVVSAENLFAQHGFAAVSLRDIATATNLTHMGIRHHFASKDDILRAVVARRDNRSRESVAAYLVEHGGHFTVDAYLDAMTQVMADRDSAQLFTKVLSESVSTDHPMHEHFRTRYGFSQTLLAEAIEDEANREGCQLLASPNDAAMSLIALSDGLQERWLFTPDEVDIPALLRQYLAAIGLQRFAAPESQPH